MRERKASSLKEDSVEDLSTCRQASPGAWVQLSREHLPHMYSVQAQPQHRNTHPFRQQIQLGFECVPQNHPPNVPDMGKGTNWMVICSQGWIDT